MFNAVVAMGDGDPRTVYIRVMDFNDTDFDRAYYEDALSQKRAAAGVEEGSRASVHADGCEDGGGAPEAPEARPQMETNEKSTSDGVDGTQELPDEEVDQDEMIVDDDGDEDWVDEDAEGENANDDDDDDEDELEMDVDDDPDARRTSEQRTRDAIEGFGSLCVINKDQKAQCERTKVALHESYVEDVFVYKQRITTSLPFRWSFRTEPEIQRWTACMMDDEHIIGLKAS
ncbi:hypothetical protein FRB90_009665 [Tulasnella sp. 427]|nr:hypothetical protein FRB90_009665 [Tulasnella sp. 427]